MIGKLKSDKTTFLHWRVRDFEDGTVDADGAREELQLTPMLPPKQVFIAGFPQVAQFAISQGFLNLIEKNQRGYFAVDINVYTESYLRSQAVALDTEWGMRTQNHMSGGAVVDVRLCGRSARERQRFHRWCAFHREHTRNFFHSEN